MGVGHHQQRDDSGAMEMLFSKKSELRLVSAILRKSHFRELLTFNLFLNGCNFLPFSYFLFLIG